MRRSYDDECAFADARAEHVAALRAAWPGTVKICQACGGERERCDRCYGTEHVVVELDGDDPPGALDAAHREAALSAFGVRKERAA